jgi:hypothetical protein
MSKTNLSIGENPVVDFDCSGWPQQKREELSQAVHDFAGVTSVTSAGISTVRVYYNPSAIQPEALIVAVDLKADEILPGYNFSG